jgi:hypothetical protein
MKSTRLSVVVVTTHSDGFRFFVELDIDFRAEGASQFSQLAFDNDIAPIDGNFHTRGYGDWCISNS